MGGAEARLRDRLSAGGLGQHVDALIRCASPSIELEHDAPPSQETVARPPAPVWGLQAAATAIAGEYHSLALRDDGIVAAWGENRCGQLGDGTTRHRRSPVDVRDLDDVAAIATGAAHSLAVTRYSFRHFGDVRRGRRQAPVRSCIRWPRRRYRCEHRRREASGPRLGGSSPRVCTLRRAPKRVGEAITRLRVRRDSQDPIRPQRPKALRRSTAAGIACAVISLSACGDTSDPVTPSSKPDQRQPSSARATLPNSAGPCAGPIRVRDASGDVRSYRPGRKPRRLAAPSLDLELFQLRVSTRGVCARWTTAAPAPPKTVFAFGVYGPPVRHRRLDVIVPQGHGFMVELQNRGARVTDAVEPSAAGVLRARVRRSGRSISVFVSRSQLDRPPPGVPERRPFPLRAFAFTVVVLSPRHKGGGRDGDHWPPRDDEKAGAVEGRLCAPPCTDRRAVGSVVPE